MTRKIDISDSILKHAIKSLIVTESKSFKLNQLAKISLMSSIANDIGRLRINFYREQLKCDRIDEENLWNENCSKIHHLRQWLKILLKNANIRLTEFSRHTSLPEIKRQSVEQILPDSLAQIMDLFNVRLSRILFILSKENDYLSPKLKVSQLKILNGYKTVLNGVRKNNITNINHYILQLEYSLSRLGRKDLID